MSTPPTPEDLRRLRVSPIFAALADDDFRLLAQQARCMAVPSGRALFMQDEPASAFFVVLHGWISLQRDRADGTRTVIRIIGPGESFAEEAIAPDARYPVNAEAASDARLLRVKTGCLRALVTDRPLLGLSLVAAVFHQQRRLVDQIEHLKSWSIERRLARELLRMCPRTGACSFHLPVEQNLIAARLAITPATLSRALKRLATVGVIAKRRHITLHNPTNIARFVENGSLA